MTENKNMMPEVDVPRLMVAISYVNILFIIPLLTQRRSKFAQFHAKQGMVLFIIELILPFIGWIPVIGWLLTVIVILTAIVAIIRSYNGESWKIPFIYQWSEKISL